MFHLSLNLPVELPIPLKSEAAQSHALSLPPQSNDNVEHSRWFVDEVQPHASAVRAYLRKSFPSTSDVDDIVQDSLLQIWLARLANPIRSAKAFLFVIARHRAIDSKRRNTRSPIDQVGDLDTLDATVDSPNAINILTRREKILILAQAIDSLPAKCREVVILRKLKDMPQKMVAATLDLSEKTVEAHLSRGLKRCEVFLRERGVHNSFSDE